MKHRTDSPMVVVAEKHLAYEPTSHPRSMTATTPLMLRVAPLADTLTEMLLQVRRTYLKCKPIAEYIKNKRRDVKRPDRATPFEAELVISMADVEDGAPIGPVTEPYKAAIALLETRHREVSHGDKDGSSLLDLPLTPLFRRENRHEMAENDSAFMVMDDEDDPIRLQSYLRDAQNEIDAQQQVMAAVRQKLARVVSRKAVLA